MEKIRLIGIDKQGNRATYRYVADGHIARAFRQERPFFVEYEFCVEDIPDAVLAVPFLANMIPIVWVYDAVLELEEIDEDFLDCLDEVKRSYAQMYPRIRLAGRLSVKRTRKADEWEKRNSLLFFSGGVDATSSLVNVIRERPVLCTLWGSDIFFQDELGWKSVRDQVENMAREFGCVTTFVKTSFRHILNYDTLNIEFAKPNHENWWHGFQHGIAILAHAAPIAWKMRIGRVYLAATASIKSTEDYLCASSPMIDNYVKYCGCSCNHEGYENSRNDKIRKICKYSRESGKRISLRVCWETRTGKNCCVCEKCARTYISILAEGYNPREFGFETSDEVYRNVVEKIKDGEWNLPHLFWEDSIRKLSTQKKLIQENVLVRYLVEKYPQYRGQKFCYIPTEIEGGADMSIDAILIEKTQDFGTPEKAFDSVGLNTGNQLFRESLLRNLNLVKMNYDEYCSMEHLFRGVPIVTTDLIWINENSNFDWLLHRMEQFKDSAFIPISVGLQAKEFTSDFCLNDSVRNVLSAMQERAIIGVRGNYTADVLDRNGIKNIEVIGCPSMFYHNDENWKILPSSETIKKVCCNFRTFFGRLSIKEKHFLTYCANRRFDFVEQTQYKFAPEIAADTEYYRYISKWIVDRKKIFFDAEEWKHFLEGYDFSMGSRFHGNVVALWNHFPALFFEIDSRTAEMIEYFEMPRIKMEDFDDQKPIEYYYELADYRDFNQHYPIKYRRYIDFLSKNHIRLRNGNSLVLK